MWLRYGIQGLSRLDRQGLEGDSRLQRAYYVCSECEGQTIFPLDRNLQLRSDHWSEGAARVATRHELRVPSFRQAAAEYADAVGGAISESSLRRLTLGTGEKMAARKAKAAEQASAPAQRGEDPRARRVAVQDALREQANASTDGTMIRIREEGWKEVKIGAISRVEVQPPRSKEADLSQRIQAGAPASRSSRRDEAPRVHLSDHSYCAGVWDADELGRHLYAEGLHDASTRRSGSVRSMMECAGLSALC